MNQNDVERVIAELKELGVQVRRVAGTRDVPGTVELRHSASWTPEFANRVAEIQKRAGFHEVREGVWGGPNADEAAVERWVELRRSDERWEAEQRQDEGE